MSDTVTYTSPSFGHEKLESPTYSDLVDIFEDRMRNWLIEPANRLLTFPHGDVPAIALILGYFEGIEIYHSGKDSKGQSKEFFRRGFKRVFSIQPEHVHLFDEIVDGLYVQARCGFAHDGLFRNRVYFSDARAESILATWPRKDGQFVTDGHLESVVINASRFIAGVVKHFDSYVAILRAETDVELKTNFETAIDLKWGLGQPAPFIGMAEDEFFGRGTPQDPSQP